MSSLSALRRPRRLASRLASGVRARLRRADRITLAAAFVAAATGVLTFLIAATVFRYHSVNHDESVYLMQAALLLSGQLEIHAGALADAVHPWFFIEDGGRLYPKYNPVPAGMYAVSMALFGEPRVTLAAVAAGNETLVYLLGSTVFDRRVGLAAAVCFAASPMVLVTGSVFLPYAPTTFLNLLFAVAYLRGVRDRSLPLAGLAGLAVGLAFFARPYTAVLFAAPFILHAVVRVTTSLRRAGIFPLSGPVRRHGLTALLGTLFVGVTLAYNLRLTGSPLTFPYQAFAPMDGPGFGERRILGHSVEYTPELALRSNGYALWYLATRWVVAGPLGTLLALAGGGVAARRWLSGRRTVDAADEPDERVRASEPPADRRFERTAGLLLAGVVVTVVVGNLFFWGTNNLLATFADPTDGLVAGFGPFYHFDLLVPVSIFGGLAVVTGVQRLSRLRVRLASRITPERARAVVVAVAALLILGGALGAAVAVEAPLDRHTSHADKYETAYEPIESASFEDDLVFVPTPYGDWLHHPFQPLRNDPGLDGPVVYALDRDPAEDFTVIDAYPDRDLRRYAYQGTWTPDPNRRVTPTLESLDVRNGARIDAETTVGVPDRVQRAVVRLEAVEGEPPGTGERVVAEYDVRDPDGSLTVDWSLTPAGARLVGAPNTTVPFAAGGDEVVVTVTLVDPAGSTFTYRQEATVRESDGDIEAVWPPERSVCRLTTECGTAGTYIPDDPDAHAEWVVFETDAQASEEE